MNQARFVRLVAMPVTAGLLAVAGCQTEPAETETVATDATDATGEALMLPTALPADSVRLSNDQLVAAFTDVAERYVSIDTPGLTASGFWLEGTMEADWRTDDASGTVAGTWFVDGQQRCIEHTAGDMVGTTECLAIYAYGDAYLSANEDGSLHGYHELQPL